MAAGLQDPLVFAHGLDHRLALANGQRKRLLAVHVFAGLGRHDDHQSVPVIGNHDGHGVDVFASQQIAEVVVGVTALVLASVPPLRVKRVDFVLSRLTTQELVRRLVAVAGRIHVADRDDLDVVLLQESGQIKRALVAVADEPHRDPVAGRGGSEHRGGDDIGGRSGRCNRGSGILQNERRESECMASPPRVRQRKGQVILNEETGIRYSPSEKLGPSRAKDGHPKELWQEYWGQNICERKSFDLDAWRQGQGWDQHSVTAQIPAVLQPETLELTWPTSAVLPQVPRLDAVPADMFGKPRKGDFVLPGPFTTVPSRPLTLPPARRQSGRER